MVSLAGEQGSEGQPELMHDALSFSHFYLGTLRRRICSSKKRKKKNSVGFQEGKTSHLVIYLEWGCEDKIVKCFVCVKRSVKCFKNYINEFSHKVQMRKLSLGKK